MTTCKNNFFFYGGQPPADHEAGRGCARIPQVVFTLNVAVELTRKILSAAKNAKHAKNQKFFTFSDVDSR